MPGDVLLEIGLAIVVATLLAFAAHRLRQPLILAYVAAGILLGGTEGFGLISTETIEPIAELGLILLLFMIGLEIDLKKLFRAGRAVASVGVLQFALGVALGLVFFPTLGFGYAGGSLAPIYLAVSAALSSTMIVVKLLYDRYELDTNAGRVTLGVLVFQDIWAIGFLALQPDLRNPAAGVLVLSLMKGLVMVAVALAASRYLLPLLFRSIARVPELLVLGALAWCFGMVLLAHALGLSSEMGALIGGVALSTFPYNLDVIAKVISLRDFFITLFFVSLGTRIAQPTAAVIGAALAMSGFVVATRFATVMPILAMNGKGARISFVTALNLAQVSEFALVISAIGLRLGHIDQRVVDTVLWAMVLTSVLSTYGITHAHRIFSAVQPLLHAIGLRDPRNADEDRTAAVARPIVFLGFARQASSLLEDLLERDSSIGSRIAVVDFNPEARAPLQRRGVVSIFGDISSADTLVHAGVASSEVIISTVPDSVLKGTTNLRLLRTVRSMTPDARVIVTSDDFEAARELYEEGAAYVLLPRLAGSDVLVPIVEELARGETRECTADGLNALHRRLEVIP